MDRPIIHTYTVIHSAAESFKNETPYIIALVEDGGRKILARLEDKIPVGIGMEVEFVKLDQRGTPVYRLVRPEPDLC